MAQAEISCVLIVKNEGKGIEKCLASVRPYVKQIVVVDTGSTDNTVDIVKNYADILEVYKECNDSSGDIMDFSMARNRAFDLASYDTTMWIDADDILAGGENLQKYVDKYKNSESPFFLQAPYEYSYDDNGKCTLVHYRERIFFKTDSFYWTNPVHEVRMIKPGIQAGCENIDDIVWKHQRQYVEKQVKPNRNLGILQSWIDKNGEDKDARQLYYIGLEYGNSGNIEKSRYFLEKYVSVSGWNDEIYMAILRLIAYSMAEKNFDDVLNLALRAIKIKPEWAEAYFEAAKACYNLAEEGKDEFNNWNRCINFARIGLSLPPTKTVLFVNPLERDIIIHRYLNFALNRVGDIRAALDSVNLALKAEPNDAALLSNKLIYEKEIVRQDLNKAIGMLKDLGAVNEEQEKNIHKTLNNETVSLDWKPYHRPAEYPRGVSEADFPVAVVSPHSQAFAIPETFVYEDLPLRMTDNQLKIMVITIWKEYLLHDELLSAELFLKNAPTRVRHHADIEELLRKTISKTEWIKNDDIYSKYNTVLDNDDEPFMSEVVPFEYALSSEAQVRLNLFKDRIPTGTKTIFDAGPNDGFISNRLAALGNYKDFIGVDGSPFAVEVANKAAIKNNTGAKYIYSFFNEIGDKLDGYGENGKFEVVVSGDVIEHLKDPVKDLLKPAYDHLKDDGKMILTAPHQSLFQGVYCPWAFPWKSSEDKGWHWLMIPRNAHIIAPTVWSIKEKFEEAGFYVGSSYRFAFPEPFVPGHSQLVVEAYKKFPGGYDKGKDIVFGIGNGLEEWNPNSVDLTGIGGSENMAILASKELARLGNKVRLYNSCGYLGEGVYDGVEYRVSEKMHDIECDIFIASRYAHMFNDPSIKAKKKILWTHDIIPYNLTKEIYNQIDVIMVLSEWHKENVKKYYPFIKDEKIFITSNGLDMKYFDIEMPRNQYKAISCSSPDRYLPSLLKAVPKIKKLVPQAEFHIFYSFYNWEEFAKLNNDQNQLAYIEDLKRQLKEAEKYGVHYHGRASQYALGREFASAGVWLYPSNFSETSCISAMNAQAAGALMITSPVAALVETAGDRAVMIEGDPMSEDYQNKFIAATVKAMTNPDEGKREDLRSYARERFDIKKVIEGWTTLLGK